jgi:DNA invertase Pin-like site-specific DNA recombinase
VAGLRRRSTPDRIWRTSTIAAIYARKNTEQNVADEQKSVARQITHAREYAARKGWTVNEACVFRDD